MNPVSASASASVSVSQQSTCPICKSAFCCCLEHLFPDLGNEPFRKKAGACHETQGYEQGPETANGPGLSQESCTWPPSVGGSGDLGLLPKGAGPGRTTVSCDYPSLEEYQQEYQQALELARDLAARPGPTPQTGQTKRASLLEAASNILIGFWVSVGANMLILPHFKNPGAFTEAFTIGLIFTIISFVRSYLLRRFFNLFHTQGRTSLRSPWKH